LGGGEGLLAGLGLHGAASEVLDEAGKDHWPAGYPDG
jgi:hypothetical protein